MSGHYFLDDIMRGAVGAQSLDEWLSKTHVVIKPPLEVDIWGIDRIVIRRDRPVPITIEYKSDFSAHRTGNAFIETHSRKEHGRAGWVYTCRAMWLIYYVVHANTAFFLKPDVLRSRLPGWIERFGEDGRAKNRGLGDRSFTGHGILLPLPELANIAERVAEVPDVA